MYEMKYIYNTYNYMNCFIYETKRVSIEAE